MKESIWNYMDKKVKIKTFDNKVYIGYTLSYYPGYEISDNAKDQVGIGYLGQGWLDSIDLDDIESIEVIED